MLREAVSCGLSCEFWHLALTGRRFGEITERMLELALPPARQI